MRRLPVVLHVVYKNDWSSAFLPGCACVHLPTMTPRVKPPHTLVSVLHWVWYCRATALSALANLTLLLGKNTLPFPAFGNYLNFVSPPHRRAYTTIPKLSPNIRFPHQQDFLPIRSVTKSSTARFFEKLKIFVRDFVPIRTALKQVRHHLFVSNPENTSPPRLFPLINARATPSSNFLPQLADSYNYLLSCCGVEYQNG